MELTKSKLMGFPNKQMAQLSLWWAWNQPSTKEYRDKVFETTGIKIDPRTATRHIRRFKDINLNSTFNPDINIDGRVDWSDTQTMIAAGINANHISKLADIDAWCISTFRESKATVPMTTLRDMKWQSYVLTMAPTITSSKNIWVIGALISGRDHMSEITKKPKQIDDIIAYLKFKSWEAGLEEKPKRKPKEIDLPDDVDILSWEVIESIDVLAELE